MSLRKNVLRPYDLVQVTKPEVFVRCGYPWTKEYVKQTVINDGLRKDLMALVAKATGRVTPSLSMSFEELMSGTPDFKELDPLMDELAYLILKYNRFGGRERKVYTETKPELMGKIGKVFDRKVVKSGRYVPGHGGYDYYYGGYDYDPPMLKDEGTHVIHLIFIDHHDNMIHSREDSEFWIPKENLRKLTQDEYYVEADRLSQLQTTQGVSVGLHCS